MLFFSPISIHYHNANAQAATVKRLTAETATFAAAYEVVEPEPESEPELDELDPLPERLQLNTHAEFHVPLEVRLFRPVTLSTCEVLS